MSAEQTPPVRKIEKPWGYEIIWASTSQYVGKILFIHAGESLSLQYHQEKEETLFLESGECDVEIGTSMNHLKKTRMVAGDSLHIPPRMLHRISARIVSRLFEVSTPQLSDVVRIQDRYGRVPEIMT